MVVVVVVLVLVAVVVVVVTAALADHESLLALRVRRLRRLQASSRHGGEGQRAESLHSTRHGGEDAEPIEIELNKRTLPQLRLPQRDPNKDTRTSRSRS